MVALFKTSPQRSSGANTKRPKIRYIKKKSTSKNHFGEKHEHMVQQDNKLQQQQKNNFELDNHSTSNTTASKTALPRPISVSSVTLQLLSISSTVMTLVPCVGSGGMEGSCVLSTSGPNHLRISPSLGPQLLPVALTGTPMEKGPFITGSKELVRNSFLVVLVVVCLLSGQTSKACRIWRLLLTATG